MGLRKAWALGQVEAPVTPAQQHSPGPLLTPTGQPKLLSSKSLAQFEVQVRNGLLVLVLALQGAAVDLGNLGCSPAVLTAVLSVAVVTPGEG